MNTKFPHTDIHSCIIKDPEKLQKDVSFVDVATDIASYQNRIPSSNSLTAMCKTLETWEVLELWVKKITSNRRDAIERDARMATEVTDILRKVVIEEEI